MFTSIGSDVIDIFVDHLDQLYKINGKVSLILYSRGGDTLAAWNIVNLIKMFFDNFEVIIPSIAHSAATLISIGVNNIVITKQATLSPIDPSTNYPFNPISPLMPDAPLPVSVEDVNGYFYLAKKEIGEDINLQNIFLHLATSIHPLALGNIARSRDQINMLANSLIQNYMPDPNQR